MDRTAEIRAALSANFDIQHLEVIDESEAHRGHSGYQEGGQSHFRVCIRSPDFAGLTRIARHRAVHSAIGAQMMGQIHALTLEIES